MFKKIPSKLYKYQSFKNLYSIENVEKKQLRFSKPEGLNDPFDSAIPFHFSDPTIEEMEAAYKKLRDKVVDKKGADEYYLTNGKPNQNLSDTFYRRAQEGMKKKIEEFSQMGIACFSENFDNILMWSHYADGHRRFCLEFDTNFEPFQDVEKVHQVIYSNIYPFASTTDVVFLPYMSVTPLITKSLQWQYEMEWRMINFNGNTAINYNPKALSGIYFGCDMPIEHRKRIMNALKDAHPTLYEMKTSETTFKVEAREYNIS